MSRSRSTAGVLMDDDDDDDETSDSLFRVLSPHPSEKEEAKSEGESLTDMTGSRACF